MKSKFRMIAYLLLLVQLSVVTISPMSTRSKINNAQNQISTRNNTNDITQKAAVTQEETDTAQEKIYDIDTDLVSIEVLDNGIIVRTPYGTFFEDTTVLIDLIYCKPMIRLLDIYQNGPSHFTKKDIIYGGVNENERETFCYTRFDHSICVWALAKLKGRPLEEQIAALLHDISHTVLSHVACFLYSNNQRTDKSWQDNTLKEFLIKHGIADILSQYNIALKDVLEKPYLDRVDYTMIGGWLAGHANKDEINTIVRDLDYNRNKKTWFFRSENCARRLVEIFLAQARKNNCATWNTVVYTYTMLALKRAFKLALKTPENITLTQEVFEYGLTDEEVWTLLLSANDTIIKRCMDIVINHQTYLEAASPTASPTHDDDQKKYTTITPKFRELNPLVCIGRGKYAPILDVDYNLRRKYNTIKAEVETGWQLDLQSFKRPIKAIVLVGY